jgi:hypothetical protein
MREEQIHVVRPVGGQRRGGLAQTGAGVKDQMTISVLHFDTGRITAVTLKFRARYGDTSPHTPEFDLEFIVFHAHFDTDCRRSQRKHNFFIVRSQLFL